MLSERLDDITRHGLLDGLLCAREIARYGDWLVTEIRALLSPN